tara:strand:- start:11944 stop:13020 length:1077 start_codon:yes stop_codon:yes gene_type:complete
MNKNNYAVIMAGGIGSRFWPESTSDLPKQFIDILGVGSTLIQSTYARMLKICPSENIYVVTNFAYKQLCMTQLPELPNSNILCEPTMRNTAPCIAYASFKIHNINPNASMIIAASDHLILKEDEFCKVVNNCLEVVANNNVLITLGITPSRPDTGYGYIQYTDEVLDKYTKIKKVKTFTEKPDQELALNFLNSGDFLWNSGMFIWNVESIRLAFRKLLRDIYDIFEAGKVFYNTDNEQEFIDRVYPGCKNVSIDYGVMEKSDNVYVYPSNFSWSDLGTWGSLYTHLNKDEHNNSIKGNRVYASDSSQNIIKVPKEKVVAIHGLHGYIVIESNNKLLICRRDNEQYIKKIVTNIKKGNR